MVAIPGAAGRGGRGGGRTLGLHSCHAVFLCEQERANRRAVVHDDHDEEGELVGREKDDDEQEEREGDHSLQWQSVGRFRDAAEKRASERVILESTAHLWPSAKTHRKNAWMPGVPFF